MEIHKEGIKILLIIFLIIAAINFCIIYFAQLRLSWSLVLIFLSLLLFVFFMRFFRSPQREIPPKLECVYSPADGTIVVIEEAYEDEYFKDKRLQVSIFMSVWDVHVNWYPVAGTVKYFRHHPGKYLVAKLPKSSKDNEHTSVVIQRPDSTEILVRQIAGAVARRIVPYAKEGATVNACQEMGFIRFGSRVDLFLPLGTKIDVELGQHVTGIQTVIANLP